MNRPYTPGIWAERYDRLPAARKDAVNREVDRTLAERTGFTGKLDPERDKDLVRAWLRIRDAVISGAANVPVRIFFRFDGAHGDSKDPRHRGWFDAARVASSIARHPTVPSGSSGAGGVERPGHWGVVVWFHEKQSVGPLMSPGLVRQSASVEFSSPGVVIVWNLTMVMVRQVRSVRPHLGVELTYGRIDYVID